MTGRMALGVGGCLNAKHQGESKRPTEAMADLGRHYNPFPTGILVPSHKPSNLKLSQLPGVTSIDGAISEDLWD